MVLTPTIVAALIFYWFYWVSAVTVGVFIALRLNARFKERGNAAAKGKK